MSLLSCLSGLGKIGGFIQPTTILESFVRDASKKAGSSTRNRCRNTPGKRRGIKVYDGQRIPSGKIVVSQYRLQILPGWNTVMLPNCNIMALTHGRVIITTEKVQPKQEEYEKLPARLGKVMPDHLLQENIYKPHIHILPDEQHQYFKLTEQI
ncbi:uncharacterized protein LOC111717878 [Eurytemora carolleeae]|uniref:uncharacterized protein LOC111717878 n=1 Tax=Eurytemora carolleeae TaxID=1294199 RepID=UPI000C75DD36|nr:uncharacterized protein LOC111717878 [Eurytemora carolleeae]|eukprot:XP_023349105.1 uncharacterized protein LOC111717878 [Eurytemora affinis]